MLHIREAAKGDFAAIYMLMKNELGYPDLDEAEAMKRLEYFSLSKDWATFVADIDDEVVGFVGVMKGMAYTTDGYYTQIMALAVSEKSRRSGVGAALVKRAEEWSLSVGIEDISVSSNERRLDAHAFYSSMGYQQYKKSLLFIKTL